MFPPPRSAARLGLHPNRSQLLRWLLAAAGLLACGSVLAEPQTFGGMGFEAPDGWTAKAATDGLILEKEFPKDAENDRKGAALIQIMAPVQASPAVFDAGFERMAGTIAELGQEDPMIESKGVTVNGHRIRTDFRCCASSQGVTIGQRTVGIASEERQVFLALITLELKDEAEDSAERDFAALVRSLRLDGSDKAFELVPAEGDGGLDGVFTYLDTGVRPNVFGGMDFYSESRITMFDPPGLYSTVIPQGGDIEAHCRQTPTDCGLYSLGGGGLFSGARTIEMRAVADEFGTIETESQSFAQADDSLTIGEREHKRVPPFEGGTRFEGTWRYFFASSGMTASSSGSVAVEKTLTFGRDGTFRRTGWSGASSTNDVGDSTVGLTTSGDRPAESGRYEVEGFTLVLVGADGREERLSLFAPDIGSDELLVINGANYLKED